MHRQSLHLIRFLSDEDVPSSVRSAMFIVTPTPDARPNSFRSGMNGILHPSQETTESTELHPATTFEQGRREDGKTGYL